MEPVEDFAIFDGFSCGDADLDDFIKNDAKNYSNELLAITYALRIIQAGDISEPVAFASILNDSIRELSNGQRRKLFPNGKRRYEQYPSVKIGRFAVAKTLRGNGIGTDFIDILKNFFVIGNRTGCRFITVDAYQSAIGFYLRNDFVKIPIQQKNEDVSVEDHTVPMFFDLKRMLPAT